MSKSRKTKETVFLGLALRLARRSYGLASPNPMVGAVLVKNGKIIGRGWHRRAGSPHAEIEAFRDAEKRGNNPKGATLYVTLEPCSTHGRTPPCTEAIIKAGIKRVVVGTTDPNPEHAGKGFSILKKAGLDVITFDAGRASRHSGMRAAAEQSQIVEQCSKLNEAFNHWIVHRTPLVIVKASMTLDGKIATASGESKWVTSEASRNFSMQLRLGADAILAGVNTILSDDPSLTIRIATKNRAVQHPKTLRRIILDSLARTPLTAKVVSDEFAALTTIVVSKRAPQKQVTALRKRANVLLAPSGKSGINLRWLLKKLGSENVTSLLIEGGGEVNASFLFGGLAQRIAFFYAPKVLGGRDSRKGVAGDGARSLSGTINLQDLEWRKIGPDLFLTARVHPPAIRA